MKVCILGSGSKGNSTVVSYNDTCILIDIGFGIRNEEARLRKAGVSPGDIQAILITHEHNDHIAGLERFSRKWKPLTYINKEILHFFRDLVISDKLRFFTPGSPFTVGSLRIHPFQVYHDSIDNVGFLITNGKANLVYATDLGFVSTVVKEKLKQANIVILESNHDREMLLQGRYPWYLKQRISSRMGHLSNEDAARALAEINHPNLKQVILAHLSEENNTPDRAKETFQAILGESKFRLESADQHSVTEFFQC